MKLSFLLALCLIPSIGVTDEPPAELEIENRYARIFTDLVRTYCVEYRDIPAKLGAKLQADGFLKNEDYDVDVFEKTIDNINYAVTIDQDVCTTDVLLNSEGTILFELDQIEEIILSELNLTNARSVIDYEISSQDNRTKVAKHDYFDEQGREYSLIFPLESNYSKSAGKPWSTAST